MFESPKSGNYKFQILKSFGEGARSSEKDSKANRAPTPLNAIDTFSMDSSQPLIQEHEREDYHSPSPSREVTNKIKNPPISFCQSITNVLNKHWFLIALGLIVLLCALVPQIGDIKWLKQAQNYMIAVLLFLTGFKLALGKITKGILSWKVHVLVQFFLLAFQPFFVWVLMKLLPNIFTKAITQAIVIIHTLPTTTSTCVVFTAASNGNEAAALFNAAFSNLAGIFTAPALGFFLILNSAASGVNIPVTKILRTLGLILIMPLCLGQLTRLLLPKILDKCFPGKIQIDSFKKGIGMVNKLVLLLITLVVFAETFAGGVHGLTISSFIGLCAFLAGLHLLWWILAFIATHFHCGIWSFDRSDRAAAMYCASQRSMATGIPIIVAMFSDISKDVVGLYTLPLVMYHTILTLVSGVFVGPLGDWVERDPHPNIPQIKPDENA